MTQSVCIQYLMTSVENEPDRPNFDALVGEFTDRLIEDGSVVFDNGIAIIDNRPLGNLCYKAICEGFGFPPGFTPVAHSWLGDSLENDYIPFINILDKVGLNQSLYWRHHLPREGLIESMKYWYEIGWWGKSAGDLFPYSGGVTAEEFMAMSEEERQLLLESDH